MARSKQGFWKMDSATMRNIAGNLLVERRDALWPRLLGPMCSMVQPGSKFGDVEESWLEAWLVENGRGDLSTSDVMAVQLPLDYLAEILGLDRKAATRAVSGLLDRGIVSLVHKGVNRHSSLYVVEPLPEPKTVSLDKG